MLTKQLLRYRFRDGRCEALFLKPTPAVAAVAEAVLGAHREAVGRTRAELDEELQRIAAAARSSVVARGLAKIVGDALAQEDPEACSQRRWEVLCASAAAMRDRPAVDDRAHRVAVAGLLGGGDPDALADTLYADLPHLARVAAVPEWSVTELIGRYNRGLAQGLVLHSEALAVTLPGGATAEQRRVLHASRFHRLLAELHQEGEGVVLRIAGPGSVIDQARRYGLQLASFLPAVCTCTRWRVEAEIAIGRGQGVLRLDQDAPLPAPAGTVGWVPPELRDLATTLAERCPDWQLDDAPTPRPLRGGEVVVPDLQIRDEDGRELAIELFHRWHHAALARRLDQLAAQPALRLALGVDRALAKRKAVKPLLEHPIFAERGFLFSGYPGVQAIQRLLRADG